MRRNIENNGESKIAKKGMKLFTPARHTSYVNFKEDDGNRETITLTQNLDTPEQDLWLIEFSISRWRSKDNLVKYLRTIADMVEGY